MEQAFLFVTMLIFSGLIINGLITKAVWSKGESKKLIGKTWAHKKHFDEEPIGYCIVMAIYLFCLGVLTYAAVNPQAFS